LRREIHVLYPGGHFILSRKLSVEQFNDILKEIPYTLAGVRNRAIFMMICINGLRRSSVLNLKGSDIEYKGNKVFFRTILKGGKSVSKEIPKPVWEAIQCYLKADGREVDENTPIFMPTRNTGDFLLEYYGRQRVSSGLSTEVINQAFKRYAKRVDIHNVSIHSLRHLGASMFYKASGDIVETR
jgi:integrase